ncbi:HupE/UreJ family protein [Variovorax defluvii]|uniref:HupE/UreJ family protein n=1 Tax=Variovorax defluvii TaxID=913761 RepID=A0ABP8ICD0_9BURK
MQRFRAGSTRLICLAACVPQLALAHGDFRAGGVVSGFLHPILGVDHLSCMVLLGALSTLGSRFDLMRVPAAFVITASVGTVWGFQLGVPSWTEPAVQVSAVLLAGLLFHVFLCRLLLIPSALAFGMLHGMAHGAELTRAAQPVAYGVGFVLATISLHVLGIGLAEGMKERQAQIRGAVGRLRQQLRR